MWKPIASSLPVLLAAGALSVVATPDAQAASCRQGLSLSVSPNPIPANANATATVRLRCRLGSHGVRVMISSPGRSLEIPASVWVPRHSNSAHFGVWGPGSDLAYRAQITARLAQAHATTTVTVLPNPVLSGFSVTPGAVVGAQAATATVTLSAPAPQWGTTIYFSQYAPWLDMPSQLTIPVGKSSASFQVSAAAGSRWASNTFQIEAYTTGVSGQPNKYLYAPLQVTTVTPGVSGVQLEGPPSYIRSGHSGAMKLTLYAPAPKQGVQVKLTSDSSALVMPGTVTVPAGQSSMDVPVTAGPVTQDTWPIITAVANGYTDTSSIHVRPAGNLDGLTRGPDYLIAPNTSEQTTLTLSYAQPTDTVVALSTSDPQVTVPATVTVPAGQTSVSFPVTVGALTQVVSVTITATLGSETTTTTYLAGPNGPRLLNLTARDGKNTVAIGGTVYGVVRFWGPIPAGGATVTLTSSDPHLPLPNSVQALAGRWGANFQAVATGTLSAPVTVTVTAAWNGQSATGQITLTP